MEVLRDTNLSGTQDKVEPQRTNDWAAEELGGNAADTLEEDIVKMEGPIEICAAKQVN